MKTKEFETKEGKKGKSYHLEVGDSLEMKYDTVGEKERLAVVKEKATKIMDYFIKVKTPDNEELTLSLTAGQAKAINTQKNKQGLTSLNGVMLLGEAYTNDWGPQVGARIQKVD